MKLNLASPRALLDSLKIHREHLRRRPLGQRIAIAVAALLLVVFIFHRKSAKTKGLGQAVPVGTAAARQGDIPVYLEGLGTVTAYYTVTLHSRVDGQLMSVNFREGQFVHDGDLLAQIDPRPFQAMLDQAKGQLARDQALLDDAKLNLDRYKGLLATNAIPKQQYDTQVATVGQYEGSVQNDKATVEAAQLNVTYARITAPISGRVGLRQVDPGNIVHAADPGGLIVITQLQPITVVFTLPEDNIPAVMRRVNTGQKLVVQAYNRDKTQLLAVGSLLTMDNEIDPTTGTSKLKAVFDNKDSMLFPNQFVNVRLLLDTKKDQVIIPSVAIQQGVRGKFVYVLGSDKTVEDRVVTPGVTEGNDTAIDAGLKAGEVVVIDGAENLKPGSLVKADAPADKSAAKP